MADKPAENSPPDERLCALAHDKGWRAKGRRRLSLAVFVIGCAGFILAIMYDSRVSALSTEEDAPFLPEEFTSFAAQSAGVDALQFTHSNPPHARLPCLLCHRRENNLARPRRPGHTPCAGCHAQQFAAASGPICTICHTNVGAEKPAVKPFPALKSFNMKFDHARHKNVDCSKCHKPANRDVALSIPTGFNAHTTCYECHSPRAQVSWARHIFVWNVP